MVNISRNVLCGIAAAVLLIIIISGCSLFGGTQQVSMKGAGDMLLQALQKKDYAQAFELLNSGAAGRKIGSADNLREMIESEKLQPQSWTWGEDKSVKVSMKGNDSYHLIDAQITFADGTKGTAHFEMEALGLINNPWRFRVFEIKR